MEIVIRTGSQDDFERLDAIRAAAFGPVFASFRSIVGPMIVPSIAAGSIFTFSLSLGDYITAQIVGGKVTMLGNVVQTTYVNNLPFAAAVATIPVVIVLLYLAAVRRAGALDQL
jgi:putative spermidine/putrescine transport system permease protein